MPTKLVHRFDAGSYVRLTEMMNAHDVGRGRGGIDGRVSPASRARTLVAGVSSDRLYPLGQQVRAGRRDPGRRRAPGDRLAVRARRLPHRGPLRDLLLRELLAG